MLIFAYYGLGKTTLCQHSDKFVDLDSQWYPLYSEEYLDKIREYEIEGKIVLVNSIWLLYAVASGDNPDYKFDQIYLPKNIDVVVSRLSNRSNVHPSFVNDLVEQGNAKLDWLKSQLRKANLSYTEIDKNSYLSQAIKQLNNKVK